jgi:predicted HD phosphohydrolase
MTPQTPAAGLPADAPRSAVDEIAALFEGEGGAEYLGEPVTQAQHMLQAAARAHNADAVRPRRWDEAAEEPDADVPGFEHYRSLLVSLVASAS